MEKEEITFSRIIRVVRGEREGDAAGVADERTANLVNGTPQVVSLALVGNDHAALCQKIFHIAEAESGS